MAEAKKNADAAEKPEKPKKEGSPGGIVMIAIITLVAGLGGGAVSGIVISRNLPKVEASAGAHGDSRDAEVEEALEKGAALQLEPFVVNLADPEVARYLRIKISLMITDKTKAKEVEENTALQQKVRDVILDTLGKKTSSELTTEEGKRKLREEIHAKLSGYFKEPKLVDVMFTEFVIQL